jgi:hypothetical protein
MVTHFKPCDCSAPDFVRERRAAWMRLLLPHLRHWSCRRCGQHFLAGKAAVAAHGGGAPHGAAGAGLAPPSPH